MTTEPHFQLTTKDHAILQVMLERYEGTDPYSLLLEHKVRSSTVYFRDDIPPGVVTLNSRLTYRVNGISAGPHLIVQSEAENLPEFALSIHTIRGLALLGLAERGTFTVRLDDGVEETLDIGEIVSQPEAESRIRDVTLRLAQGDNAGNVVSFSRRPARNAYPQWTPGDDDPGPGAA